MSRIGKQPIKIPEGVEVKINNQEVIVKGPKGELTRNVRPEIKVEIKNNNIIVTPQEETKDSKPFWGLERSLLQNMLIGITQGFEKKLEIRGIGYKGRMEKNNLILEVGFSHLKEVLIPEDLEVSVKDNIITITGIDKAGVGQLAAKIKQIRPPDAYKGKGIRYLGEEIKLKPGKKAATAG